MTDIKTKLSRTALKVLRPLVRILLRNGISHSEFSEIARLAFVEVGLQDFQIPGRKQTVSRVAVITGLSRKEVLRLYNVSVAGKEEKEQKPINRAVRVVNGWLNDDEFSRENQEEPLSLEIQGEHGSFSALVKRYSGDITAGAVLDELVRVGLVEKQGSKVVLKKEGYLPMEGKQEMIEVFGICTTDLLETIDFNLKTDTEQRFQRALIYHNLPKDLVDEFKAFSEEKSNLLLRELNRWLSRRKKRIESTAAEEKIRTGIGVYYFETDETHKSDSYVADLENIHAGKGRGEGT